MNAWTISQATFYSWITLKLVLLVRGGWASTGLGRLRSLLPLFLFFAAVAATTLTGSRWDGNYRDLLFGCLHAIMLTDLFAKRRPLLLWLLGFFPFVLVVRGLVHDPAILDLDISHRLGYPLLHPVSTGYLLAMSIPLCCVCGLGKANLWRSLGLLSCATQILGVILTFSRGAWLACGASLVYLAFAAKKWKALAVFAIIAAICVLVFSPIQHRLATLARPQADPSISDRLQLLIVAAQLGLANPVFGVGYGKKRFKDSIQARLQGTSIEGSPFEHAHNLYLEIFARAGFLGLLSLLWLMGRTLILVWRAARRRDGTERLSGFAIAAAWIAAAVAGVGEIPFYHYQTRLFFFSLLALAHLYAAGNTERDLGDSVSRDHSA